VNKLPNYIEVNSPLEFSRLVCALERATRVSFLHEHKGKKVLSVQMDMLKESPVIYYTPVEKFGQFLSYGFKSGKEESLMVDSAMDTSKLFSPIVKIKSLPKSLQASPNDVAEKYQPIEFEDLGSLAKLSYGFEEAPFPLFTFPFKGKWLIGVFLNFNEDGDSYFCYVSLNKEPNKPFLRHTTTNATLPIFVDNTAEHGYSYIKIVKLHDTHPLVNYDQIQN